MIVPCPGDLPNPGNVPSLIGLVSRIIRGLDSVLLYVVKVRGFYRVLYNLAKGLVREVFAGPSVKDIHLGAVHQ